MIFFTDKLVPANAAGCARGPVIFIRPKYRDDQGLIAHEKEHVRQWLTTLGLHSFLYLLSDQYKLWAEVEAYKIQATYYADDRRPMFARFIANDYNLDVSESEVLGLLNV